MTDNQREAQTHQKVSCYNYRYLLIKYIEIDYWYEKMYLIKTHTGNCSFKKLFSKILYKLILLHFSPLEASIWAGLQIVHMTFLAGG